MKFQLDEIQIKFDYRLIQSVMHFILSFILIERLRIEFIIDDFSLKEEASFFIKCFYYVSLVVAYQNLGRCSEI
jgi:hypothetical protein